MTVEAYYPWVVEPFHTWQNIIDFDGRRYLYQYVRRDLGDFRHHRSQERGEGVRARCAVGLGLAGRRGQPVRNGRHVRGGVDHVERRARQDDHGASVRDSSASASSTTSAPSPTKSRCTGAPSHLKGFKVYEMNGPLPDDWTLLVGDDDRRHAPERAHRRAGWLGGARHPHVFRRQVHVRRRAAPDATFALTEYPTDLYSSGYQAWDMSDPVESGVSRSVRRTRPATRRPRGVRQQPALRQPHVLVRRAHAAVRADAGGRGRQVRLRGDGGARAVRARYLRPGQHESGRDTSSFPPNVAGTEGDNIDVSQVEKTGIIYYSGYPLAESCYEPYKDVYAIDVSDPENRPSWRRCRARCRRPTRRSTTSVSVAGASARSAPGTTPSRERRATGSFRTRSTTPASRSST